MSKTNAKQEFLLHTRQVSLQNPEAQILCCTITKGDDHSSWEEEQKCTYQLTTGFTKEEHEQFLDKIDFMYDSGYGGQELFGTIWYKDGTWSERGEYDGSEWWHYQMCPEIPPHLKRIDKEREEKLNQILG